MWNSIKPAKVRAQKSGALVPLLTESQLLSDAGLPYEAAWISSLSMKLMIKTLQTSSVQQDNPFLPYDRDLYIADLPPAHVLIFNKFAISEDHVLLITREFEAQECILNRTDFTAITAVYNDLGGTWMFNGGSDAGASQFHKHVHFMPHCRVALDDYFCERVATNPQGHVPEFPFVHTLLALDLSAESGADDKATYLFDCYQRCLAACNISEEHRPHYNILATRNWMLLVPRSAGEYQWGDNKIPVHSLSFGGQINVAEETQLALISELGLIQILAATTIPLT